MSATRRSAPLLAGVAALAVASLSVASCTDPPEPRPDPTAVDQVNHYEEGRTKFLKYCALCHGPEAHGYAADHAPSLVSRTFLESVTDEYIARAIREGRAGTAMASYSKSHSGPLEESDIADIIAFLRDRGPLRVKVDGSSVLGDERRGEAIFVANCQRCHGTRFTHGDAVSLVNKDLLSSATDGFLRYAIVHGRPGTPMPSFEGVLGEDDIDNAVAYLRSFSNSSAATRSRQPDPPPMEEPIINPKGANPVFQLREDRFVPIEAVRKAIDEKKRIVIIDARAVPDFLSMHIPGAISVPYYSFSRLDDLPKDGTWITAYCACPHHASGVVVDELRRRGFPKTAILDEGILEWKKRGYPTVAEERLP